MSIKKGVAPAPFNPFCHMPELVALYVISEVGFQAGVNRGRMTLQALKLPKKVAPASNDREQVHAAAVDGKIGEIAMNDGCIETLSIPLFAAGGRVSTAVV